MSKNRARTFDDAYSPEHLARLDAMVCPHDEPRGARYCPLCRRNLAALRAGRQVPFEVES